MIQQTALEEVFPQWEYPEYSLLILQEIATQTQDVRIQFVNASRMLQEIASHIEPVLQREHNLLHQKTVT